MLLLWETLIINFLFLHENKGNALGVLTQEYSDHHRPIGYYSQLDSVPQGLPPWVTAISAIATCKQTEETVMGSPLFIFLILLNLHGTLITLNTSVSQLASYEVLLLSAPNITLA